MFLKKKHYINRITTVRSTRGFYTVFFGSEETTLPPHRDIDLTDIEFKKNTIMYEDPTRMTIAQAIKEIEVKLNVIRS